MILLIIFFVTSSDSGSLVIDMITSGGKFDAPVSHRVFWCTMEGGVAIVLLLGRWTGFVTGSLSRCGFSVRGRAFSNGSLYVDRATARGSLIG